MTSAKKDVTQKNTSTLFYAGYSLFIISNLLINSTFIKENRIAIVSIGAILIAMSVFVNLAAGRLSKNKSFLWLLFIAIIAFISGLITHDLNILMLVAVIAGTMTISFDEFVKKDILIRLVIVVLVVMLFSLGMLPTGDVIREQSVRYALGFQHPNTLGMQIMMLVLEFGYIFRRHRAVVLLMTLAAIIFLLLIPNSRAAVVVLAIFLAFVLFNKVSKKIICTKIVRGIISFSFLIFTVVSLGMTFLVSTNSEFAHFIDELTSWRLTLYSQAMDEPGITIIGNSYDNKLENTLDNAYLRLLISFGVIQYLILLVLSYNVFRKMYYVIDHDKDVDKNIELVFMLFIMQTYGLVESSSVYIQRNGFLCLYGESFKNRNKMIGYGNERKKD